MWFAPRQSADISSVSRILAPIPDRYSEIEDGPDPGMLTLTATFQFSATIDKLGHVGAAMVLRGPTGVAMRRRVLDELASWVFKPALSNGEPTDVDVVLEIPFRLQPADRRPIEYWYSWPISLVKCMLSS